MQMSVLFKTTIVLVAGLSCYVQNAYSAPPDPNISNLGLSELLFNPGNLTPPTGQDCSGNGIAGQEGLDEFVEFTNTGAVDINLGGYCLSNRSLTDGAELPGSDTSNNSAWIIPDPSIVPPGGFFSLCGTSFSNDDANGDQITFFNNSQVATSHVTVYEPATAGDCTTSGGNDVDTVVYTFDYDQTAEQNGQALTLCNGVLDYQFDTNGEIILPSPDAENCTASLPVTLASFETQKSGASLKFIWSTSSETFNFGFNLWGEVEGQWYRLNKAVVPSRGADSLTTQRYQKVVSVTDLPGEISQVGISSVEINGREEFFGPYEPGKSYGEDFMPDTIAWDAIAAEASEHMTDMGYVQRGRNWVKQRHTRARRLSDSSTNLANRALTGNSVLVEFRTAVAGVHRVTHADLLAANVDLFNTNASELALTHNGNAQARYVHAANDVWNETSYVDFYTEGPGDELLLHDSEVVYRLELDGSKVNVLPAGEIDREVLNAGASHQARAARNEQKIYDFVMPKPDPWYEQYLTLNPYNEGAPGTLYTFALDAAHVSSNGDMATVTARVITLTDFVPGVDHKLQLVHVDTSGAELVLGTQESDGYDEVNLAGRISASALALSNQFRVKLKLIDTDVVTGQLPAGWYGSTVYFDRASVTYTANSQASDDVLYWTQDAQDDYGVNVMTDGYAITALSSDDVAAYAYADGSLIRLTPKKLQQHASNNSWSLDVAKIDSENVADDIRYWVSTQDALNRPVVSAPELDASVLSTDSSDYLMIAHPAFINRLLNPDVVNGEQDFIANKQSHGHNVKVVDYEQVAQIHGYGHRTPDAITAYLAVEKQINPGLQYVLLIGNASRDPNDYTGNGSWNMVPTYYDATHSFLHYAPNDGALADLDDDGFQDLAIGRWPVRTEAELNIMITKTIKYTDGATNTPATQTLNTAVLAADIDDGINNFSGQMNSINDQLAQAGFATVQVYKDSGAESQNLIDAINAGQSITTYSGHAGPSQWSYSGMLHYSQVSALNNTNHPTLTLPLSCYTTYAVSEHTDTLGQKLMNHDGGSVAILGAASLTSFSENEAVITDVMQSMTTGVDTDGDGTADITLSLGEAVTRAKKTMIRASSAVNVSGNLLGDPSLRISIQNSTSNMSIKALRAY